MMDKTITTADQAVMNVFSLLKPLKPSAGLTGSVYPYNRPLNSSKEDVVVSVLAFGAEQEQNGMLNVNVHVPNLIIAGDTTQPNRSRFNTISEEAIDLLDFFDGTDFTLTLDNAGELMRDGEKWFMNIRVRYNTIRLDNI